MKRTSHKMARALLLAGAVALTPAAGAMAQEAEQSPEALAAEGLNKLVSVISLFLQSIPQYETPEILPNGDIIIRRVQPDEGPGDGQDDDGDHGDGPSDQGPSDQGPSDQGDDSI